MSEKYAHSLEGQPPEEWQPLEEHLKNVAEMAAEFAMSFGAEEWGRCSGILHDLGKASEEFQRRLKGEKTRVDHSTFGARKAQTLCGRLGILMAYIIAGHHGGLPDGGEQKGQLHFRLDKAKLPEIKTVSSLPEYCHDLNLPFSLSRESAGFSISMFTRMIFSCLVDADFLDTERFCSPERADTRPVRHGRGVFDRLLESFNAHMHSITKNARQGRVNRLRKEVLHDCIRLASSPGQIFSLTVPTGGGKTLSSMAFALHHAKYNGMERIIYAIPFTSIIEQNAGIFKEIFGKDMVLEHHSNFNVSEQDEDYMDRHRLVSENWDSPIVVTTNVQFFESLFSNRTSKCRKLHNVANSIIILDEAQAIPTGYLRPCLAVLRELVKNYGCSVVMCTATQPALDDTSSLRSEALPEIKEIVNNTNRLFRELKRTKINFIGKKTDEELASLIDREKRVLCIVSTRKQAQTVFRNLQSVDIFHLSTNMYPLHRQRVLHEIRERLNTGKPCRVVSTSLVEAGVDVDFPVVYRAMAGLDSIAQAAGRCNREGRLNEQGRLGQVFVFESDRIPSMPWLKRCISRGREALRSLPGKDPAGHEMMRRYFELLYDIEELDIKKIIQMLNPVPLEKDLVFPFREVSKKFRFIEGDTTSVIVAIETETGPLIETVRHAEYTRATIRALQPYTVQVRHKELNILCQGGSVEIINEKIPVLINRNAYDKHTGLCIDNADSWDAEALMV